MRTYTITITEGEMWELRSAVGDRMMMIDTGTKMSEVLDTRSLNRKLLVAKPNEEGDKSDGKEKEVQEIGNSSVRGIELPGSAQPETVQG